MKFIYLIFSHIEINDEGILVYNNYLVKKFTSTLTWDKIRLIIYDDNNRIIFYSKVSSHPSVINELKNMDDFIFEMDKFSPDDITYDISFKIKLNEIINKRTGKV
ncbi:MAG: hypothetical protein ACOC2W_03395 [bacterium]